MANEMLERLAYQIVTELKLNSPYLSGNMRAHITMKRINQNQVEIAIEAPPYDINAFFNSPFRPIIYIDGKDYAYDVNYKTGGFSGKHLNWVENNMIEACEAVASIYNAEVRRLGNV